MLGTVMFICIFNVLLYWHDQKCIPVPVVTTVTPMLASNLWPLGCLTVKSQLLPQQYPEFHHPWETDSIR
jgi:hypothetical protein